MKCLRLLDVVTHEDREDLVGDGGLLDGDLQQRAPVGVHRGLAELVAVHLAEALEALELLLVVRVLGEEPRLGGVVLQVHLLACRPSVEYSGGWAM